MVRFMVLTFVVLGWAFYEMSGGADFSPPDPVPAPRIAQGEPEGAVTLIGADEATRAAPVVLASLDAPRVVTGASAFGPTAFGAGAPVAAEPVSFEPEATDEPLFERRTVAGSRVNMREGPGTGFPVVDVLSRGEGAEILAVEDGWARVRSEGREGWMALSLLSEAG